jgi:hypothetical protein
MKVMTVNNKKYESHDRDKLHMQVSAWHSRAVLLVVW